MAKKQVLTKAQSTKSPNIVKVGGAIVRCRITGIGPYPFLEVTLAVSGRKLVVNQAKVNWVGNEYFLRGVK